MKRGLEIGGGKLKGKKIQVPSGTRPTQGLVKRSLFDRLGGSVDGMVVLDLFAGSGAIGIEALSRGASEVWFVEKSHRALQILKKNLKNLGLLDKTKVIKGDALKVLRNLSSQGIKFDLVFADPPYNFNKYQNLLEVAKDLIEDGVIIVESRKEVKINPIEGLKLDKEAKLGETKITIYRRISG